MTTGEDVLPECRGEEFRVDFRDLQGTGLWAALAEGL